METFTRLNHAADFISSQFSGSTLSLALPLGLGKPNQLINLLYDRFKIDQSRYLKIFTALSLDIPVSKSDLEVRFAKDFLERHFGADYPVLNYVRDIQARRLPNNISVEEFYFQAGKYLGNVDMQTSYNSLNYTHVARALFNSNIQVILQLVAASPDRKRFSLSCNPDLTLDVVDLYRNAGKPLMVVGVVHPDLPFLGGDAEVDASFFQVLVDTEEVTHTLFAPPKMTVSREEHLIGFHASQLVTDNGTLQIGIGALSDALVYSTVLRHQKNRSFNQLVRDWNAETSVLSGVELGTDPFDSGIYGTSEMIMDGFMHLRKAGILKRKVRETSSEAQRYLHGAFFLGSKDFYKWLRELSAEDYSGLAMTRVSKVNDLYDSDENALRRQRIRARFFNTCMNVTLLGAAASETLENGQVISGVGGQYNFVAMSQELADSHSVLMLRSTRRHNGRRVSNIVWSHGHLTIPRHLRDIVVTEYGIAVLRGQNDETVIQRLLNITDSEFQTELLDVAKKNKKIKSDYQIPVWARNNTPEKVNAFFSSGTAENLFPEFPFGSDFTPVEERLQKALLFLKEAPKKKLAQLFLKGLRCESSKFQDELERMKQPKFLFRTLLLGALDSVKK